MSRVWPWLVIAGILLLGVVVPVLAVVAVGCSGSECRP